MSTVVTMPSDDAPRSACEFCTYKFPTPYNPEVQAESYCSTPGNGTVLYQVVFLGLEISPVAVEYNSPIQLKYNTRSNKKGLCLNVLKWEFSYSGVFRIRDR